MSEIQEDNTPELEGVVESPNVRQKVFSNPKTLGQYLMDVQPKVFQVQPTRGGKYILTTEFVL